jgi:hypothetical protein
VDDIKTGIAPKVAGGFAERGIDFDADSAFNPFRPEDGQCRGIETSGADSRIGEMDGGERIARDGFDVASDFDRQGVGRGELAEPVPLGPRPARIELRLHCQAARLDRVIAVAGHVA